MKKLLVWAIIPLFLSCLMFSCGGQEMMSCETVETMLTSDEIKELSDDSTVYRIKLKDLTKWDQLARDLVSKFPMEKAAGEVRLFAYLYWAQGLFADESFYVTGAYSGTIDPLSVGVIRLFYPDHLKNIFVKSDPFSNKLAKIVLDRIKKRFYKEEAEIAPSKLSQGPNKWTGENPVGIKYASLKPWVMKAPSEFRTPNLPPNTAPFWGEQIDEVKEQSINVKTKQVNAVDFWSNTKIPFFWLSIAEGYMDGMKTSLTMQLHVRRKMAEVVVDAMIASYDSKYAHMIERPNQQDKLIKTVVPTPNSPSYPSTYATVSTAAATALSYYFPENRKEWEKIAREAGASRVWAGVHFPSDVKAGEDQGFKIGRAVIFR